MLTVPDLEEDVDGEHAHQLKIYLTDTSVVLWIRGGQIEISFSIHEFIYWTKSDEGCIQPCNTKIKQRWRILVHE